MIFSGDLCDKVLDGTKTVTRRPVTPGQPCRYAVGKDVRGPAEARHERRRPTDQSHGCKRGARVPAHDERRRSARASPTRFSSRPDGLSCTA